MFIFLKNINCIAYYILITYIVINYIINFLVESSYVHIIQQRLQNSESAINLELRSVWTIMCCDSLSLS